MLTGAHAIIYSSQADADRAFLRDVLALPSVDAGDGWLIFGLPPSEVAIHPGDRNDIHELYLMCDDVQAFVGAMNERGVACSEIADRGWGLLTSVTLPGGGKLGVYQARHGRPKNPSGKPTKAKADKKKAKKAPAAKKAKKGGDKKADKKAGKKKGKK